MQNCSNYRYCLNHYLFIALVKWTVSRDSNFFEPIKFYQYGTRGNVSWWFANLFVNFCLLLSNKIFIQKNPSSTPLWRPWIGDGPVNHNRKHHTILKIIPKALHELLSIGELFRHRRRGEKNKENLPVMTERRIMRRDCRNNFQEVNSLKQPKSFHNRKLFKKVQTRVSLHTPKKLIKFHMPSKKLSTSWDWPIWWECLFNARR